MESLVAFNDDGLAISNMGVDFRDWNNDGRPGLFVTALGGETFPLFRNEGTGYSARMTYKAGIGFQSDADERMGGGDLRLRQRRL